jgi:hypothetical protein
MFLAATVKNFLYIGFRIESLYIWLYQTYNLVYYHLITNDESAVRIDIGDVDARRDAKPALSIKAIDGFFVTQISLELASEQD